MASSFPLYYVPRPYQEELHYMWKTKRTGVAVLPRQSGKDVSASMENVRARLERPKTTGVYVAPDRPSIKNILWDKTYVDPKTGVHIQMLQDNVPPELVKWKNTDLEGKFKNKSTLKLQGYFQTGGGTNGVGTSFQDYTFTELSLFAREDPIPRLMPIISSGEENGDPKRLMAVATPRGKRNNSLWQLIQSMEGDPSFGLIVRTIEDLNEIMRRNGLPPVRGEAQLERDRETYLRRHGNARMFEQEFYVSFEEMDAAAVYGEALNRILIEHRNERFNLHADSSVYVMFDIGASGKHSDATAWVAFQWINNKLYLYDCGEGHGKALPEYVDDLQTKHWFSKLAYIILPWDAGHHEKAVNTTPADMMRQRFPNVAVLARGTNIWTAPGLPTGDDADIITMVQQVRLQMYNTYINGRSDEEKKKHDWRDEPNCDLVLECMENYKYRYDNIKQEWTSTPVHDKYSHIMDCVRYIVQATQEMDFFGGQPFDTHAQSTETEYKQDWSNAW